MPALLFNAASPNEDLVAKMASLPRPRTTLVPRHRFHKYGVQIEWIRHSCLTGFALMVICVLATSYYTACLLTQYGTLDHFPNDTFKPEPFLDEGTLTRVIMFHWMVLAVVLLLGICLYRRIFMPLYIFLAILATNGTLVLFVIKMKQFWDGKIPQNDLSLNLSAMLLVTATAHNLIYIYALHLHKKAQEYNRHQRLVAAMNVASSNGGKKDVIDNFV